MLCAYCSKECKNERSKKQHEIRCKYNPTAIVVKPSYGMLGKKGANQFTTGKATSLSVEARKKISDASKKQVWDDNRKAIHKAAMQLAVKNNPESYTSSNVCGRVKIEEYNGVKFHGKWEVEVAKWLDSNQIRWTRDIRPFNYFWNGSWHLYFPDFYLPDRDLYIEVKGYETERDRCKWSVVKNLLTIKQKDITLIKCNTFLLPS